MEYYINYEVLYLTYGVFWTIYGWSIYEVLYFTYGVFWTNHYNVN